MWERNVYKNHEYALSVRPVVWTVWQDNAEEKE